MLNSIAREEIINFLSFEYGEITKAKTKNIAIMSIIFLYAPVYFVENRIMWGVFLLVPSGIIIASVIYMMKNVEYNKKNGYKWHGLYTAIWSMSCCILGYVLLTKYMGKDIYWFWLLVLIAVVCTMVITISYFLKKISSNYYKNASLATYAALCTVGGSIVVTSRLVIRPATPVINGYLYIGIMMVLAAMALCMNIAEFALRIYCYKWLEKEEKVSVPQENICMLVENSGEKICAKAKKWLDEHQIQYSVYNIKSENIITPQLKHWHERQGGSIDEFFDTNDTAYKSMKLQKRLDNMTDEEKYELLAKNNSLLKLPLIVCNDFVLIGFRENVWEEQMLKNLIEE